jgi:hypothetical protein
VCVTRAWRACAQAVPQLASLGPLFKSCAAVRLTEEDTEYNIVAVKHVFDDAVVVQFNCTNTITEQILEDVSVVVDLADAVRPPPLHPPCCCLCWCCQRGAARACGCIRTRLQAGAAQGWLCTHPRSIPEPAVALALKLLRRRQQRQQHTQRLVVRACG